MTAPTLPSPVAPVHRESSTLPPRLAAHERLLDAHREQAARIYIEQLRAFFVHASVFGAGMVVIVVVNLATNIAAGLAGEWSAWWSIWAFIGWGLGLITHGVVVRLSRPAPVTSSWEQRKLDAFLDR